MFNDRSIEKIRDLLLSRSQTVSTAESVTAGLLQAALSSADKALQFFEGGITAYNINQKARHLGIDKKEGEDCNCVSRNIAIDMARGACRLFASDWGISVTGYATTVPESDYKLFAYYAICQGKEVCDSGRLDLHDEKPLQAQLHYVNDILDRFSKILEEKIN